MSCTVNFSSELNDCENLFKHLVHQKEEYVELQRTFATLKNIRMHYKQQKLVFCEHVPNLLALKNIIDFDEKLKRDLLEEVYVDILNRTQCEYNRIEKHEKDSLHFKLLVQFKRMLNISEKKNQILQSIKNCKFNKHDFNGLLSHSLIIGADEGIYILLNTLQNDEINILKEDKRIDFGNLLIMMNDKEKGKTVIGEGSFGKIRLSLILISNKKKAISLMAGNLICVKKAGKSKTKERTHEAVWKSTWNDYTSIDFLDDTPEIVDMRITVTKIDDKELSKGYCFQKFLMIPNAKDYFEKQDNKKWIHLKSYCTGIFDLMIALHDKGICMTDLKPANTLYE